MISILTPTIGEMVVQNYRKAEVFRKYGLDYCCGGKKTLEEACQRKGLDPETIQQDLDALDLQPSSDQPNFEHMAPDALADYIVQKHHAYVLDSLPILYELSLKVARVHGEKHPELLEIARLFHETADELQQHLLKEERILFPFIREMAIAQRLGAPSPRPVFGKVGNPIHMMESEHESAGSNMEQIRTLSSDYTPPEGACTSYRVLFAKLEEFENDLHQHVHLENNILFPGALRMEGEIAG